MTIASSETTNETACGFIAIIGAPNAGKSTLINTLVGSKISIVTPKVQTTRMRVRGVTIVGSSQLIFVDTPGIFRPAKRLDRAMVSAAWEGATDSDVILFIIDAAAYRGSKDDPDGRRHKEALEPILERLGKDHRPKLLVLNKVDLIDPRETLKMVADLNARIAFAETFMISALKGEGMEVLLKAAARLVPKGPWLYPEDQLADLPLRLIAAEIVREKLMLKLHQELPYALTVETEGWEDRADGSVKIDVTIFVERDGQKAIVVGKGGRMLKDIGQSARHELAAWLERKVHLFLFVKVRENWADDPERYAALGLDYPKN